MERTRTSPTAQARPSRVDRQLAPLKLVSRLLGHELHVQQSPRITLSREEVLEIQTTLDLYIAEVAKARQGVSAAGSAPHAPAERNADLEVQAVPARTN